MWLGDMLDVRGSNFLSLLLEWVAVLGYVIEGWLMQLKAYRTLGGHVCTARRDGASLPHVRLARRDYNPHTKMRRPGLTPIS